MPLSLPFTQTFIIYTLCEAPEYFKMHNITHFKQPRNALNEQLLQKWFLLNPLVCKRNCRSAHEGGWSPRQLPINAQTHTRAAA